MAISSAMSLAEKIDGVVTAIETGKAFADSNTALEVTADLAQIAAVTAVGGLVAAGSRFTDPLIRLSAAISGNKDALAAKGWLSGLVVAEALSKAIDKFNESRVGVDIIEIAVNDWCDAARNWVPPRYAPLALDLDGDGIETVGANGAVLFDHNGDGIQTATGWVKADDGLLVLDRNGNGKIDTGAELFGVDTVLANGQKASNGFAALRDFDANGDNVFDVHDTRFADVRIWRDLSQDGITQAGELFTLQSLGIAALNLNATNRAVNLGNGNIQTASAAYVRTDGTTGEAAEIGLCEVAANLEFAQNPFYRQFTDSIPLTEQASLLPQLRGSGMVRDLREAA